MIILEVSGHDHLADIRYHKGPLPELFMKDFGHHKHHHSEPLPADHMFHNVLINPGLTSADGTNPGYSTF